MSQKDDLYRNKDKNMIDSDRELAEMSANRVKEDQDNIENNENNKTNSNDESREQNMNKDSIFLIECPACHKSISNHAISCPHCGHPMKPQERTAPSAPQPVVQQKSGMGFWGIVFAVIVALLIMSIG